MLDLTVIILTKNEELHIARCLENIQSISQKIFIIDSHSNDATQNIANAYGAEVIEHTWPGNQAAQFNWAIDNLDIQSEWILRIDADEYLLPDLIEELKEKLPIIPDDVTGIFLNRRHIFLDRWMRGGIYPVKLLRLFRRGYGRYEQRLMDEHIILSGGKSIEFDNDFCDHNLNNISWFCKKHVDYAIREAVEMIDSELNISNHTTNNSKFTNQAREKRRKKESYAKFPLFWRAIGYFLYRYFIKGGWRDGKEGFLFTFLQGFWYRTLVDAKIYEIKKKCGTDTKKIKQYLISEYGINF